MNLKIFLRSKILDIRVQLVKRGVSSVFLSEQMDEDHSLYPPLVHSVPVGQADPSVLSVRVVPPCRGSL